MSTTSSTKSDNVKVGLSLREECEQKKKKADLEKERDEYLDMQRRRNYRRRSPSPRSPSRERKRSTSPFDYRERSRHSRDHSRDRDYYRDRENDDYHRDRDRYRRRSRSRSPVRKRTPPKSKPIDVIQSSQPKYLNARVFIGNLPSDNVGKEELVTLFDKHGEVLDVAIFRGFGFVQFKEEEAAKKAVEAESGSLMRGQRLDVKMAFENRKTIEKKTDPYINSDDPYLGPKRDAYRPVPAADPYRGYPPPRPGPDPYAFASAPAPRPPVPYSSRLTERRPFECQIIMLAPKHKGYAEMVESKLTSLEMTVDIYTLPPQADLTKVLGGVTRRGILYAAVIGPQNEMHRSITLNILHGTPQEHRNMPLDDCLKLMVKNFEEYKLDVRENPHGTAAPRRAPPPPPPPATVDFVPPDKETHYLLNLLADNRILTLEELDLVIKYLQERRRKVLAAKGIHETPPSVSPAAAGDAPRMIQKTAIDKEQEKLTDNILSMLNGSDLSKVLSQAKSSAPQPVPAPSQQPRYSAAPQMSRPMPSASSTSPASSLGTINFDNPSVKRALDDLISSGPNLLKNLGSISSSVNPGVSPSIMSRQQQPTQQRPPQPVQPPRVGGLGANWPQY